MHSTNKPAHWCRWLVALAFVWSACGDDRPRPSDGPTPPTRDAGDATLPMFDAASPPDVQTTDEEPPPPDSGASPPATVDAAAPAPMPEPECPQDDAPFVREASLALIGRRPLSEVETRTAVSFIQGVDALEGESGAGRKA